VYTILKNAKATEVLHDIPSCRKDNCHFLITERMQPGRTAVNIIGCVMTGVCGVLCCPAAKFSDVPMIFLSFS